MYKIIKKLKNENISKLYHTRYRGINSINLRSFWIDSFISVYN